MTHLREKEGGLQRKIAKQEAALHSLCAATDEAQGELARRKEALGNAKRPPPERPDFSLVTDPVLVRHYHDAGDLQ